MRIKVNAKKFFVGAGSCYGVYIEDKPATFAPFRNTEILEKSDTITANLGLKLISCHHDYYDHHYYYTFEVIDKEKYFLATIKYGF
jgi:hypothetical protein